MTDHSTEQWTVTRLLDWTAQYLAQKSVESPRLDAEVLLAHSLGWNRIDLYARYDQTPSEEIRKQFKALIGRRLEALAVAARNARRHKVADRIRFFTGDLFAPLSEPGAPSSELGAPSSEPGALATGQDRFDFILSNPPYIPHEELTNLARGVRD